MDPNANNQIIFGEKASTHLSIIECPLQRLLHLSGFPTTTMLTNPTSTGINE